MTRFLLIWIALELAVGATLALGCAVYYLTRDSHHETQPMRSISPQSSIRRQLARLFGFFASVLAGQRLQQPVVQPRFDGVLLITHPCHYVTLTSIQARELGQRLLDIVDGSAGEPAATLPFNPPTPTGAELIPNPA